MRNFSNRNYQISGLELKQLYQKVNARYSPSWSPEIWDYSMETRGMLAKADLVLK